MRLLIECDTEVFPIAISAEQESFDEMRAVCRMLRDARKQPSRVICDREARHWMDVHAIKNRDTVISYIRLEDGVTLFDKTTVPIVIEDTASVL